MKQKFTCAASLIWLCSLLLIPDSARAQRRMEQLDRGTAAVLRDNGDVYLHCRRLGTDSNNIDWQNVAYNQPPHPSFYLGHGMSARPRPNIAVAGESD